MKTKIAKCKKCGRQFKYSETGNIWPGGKDREDADCPYCGETVFSRMTSGFINVYKLEDDEEE
ncbi:MAG: zinc ribbon-containing protein [Ruminococcus sp.]|uniref:hypothetical protein n=1 Tax=Ruminococcus sp. TaxID=41978 RepID=UPI0025CB8374|nr:hypothetical protein [Ruminococcus sp.]MCR5600566.1 zinc ribbon-containing protein [Ruminococcus sp.]